MSNRHTIADPPFGWTWDGHWLIMDEEPSNRVEYDGRRVRFLGAVPKRIREYWTDCMQVILLQGQNLTKPSGDKVAEHRTATPKLDSGTPSPLNPWPVSHRVNPDGWEWQGDSLRYMKGVRFGFLSMGGFDRRMRVTGPMPPAKIVLHFLRVMESEGKL